MAMSDIQMTPEEKRLQKAVQMAYERLNSYHKVARLYGGNPAEARRIAHGKFPASARRRKELGLPLLRRARACDHCGDVHLRKSKRCPMIGKTLDDYDNLHVAPVGVLREALLVREVLK